MSYCRREIFHRAVVIADVPSPLAQHHRPSRSDSTRARARTICVDPVGALPRPARPRPIFYPWADANGSERTICVGGMRQPAGDGLRASPLAPQELGAPAQKISPSRAPIRFFHPARRMFSSDAPDPNPVHGGGAGAPAGRVTRRMAHCQRHDRCFIVSTRPSPRLSHRITAPAAALPSGVASRRVGTRVA
jgi:hypothetical protein